MTNRTVVHGAIVEAASAVPIDIAIEFKPGIPGLTILGIQDNAAVELRGIVRCALRAQGYETVALSMSSLRLVIAGPSLVESEMQAPSRYPSHSES